MGRTAKRSDSSGKVSPPGAADKFPPGSCLQLRAGKGGSHDRINSDEIQNVVWVFGLQGPHPIFLVGGLLGLALGSFALLAHSGLWL